MVAVVGSGGFVGTRLTSRLKDAGIHVFGITRDLLTQHTYNVVGGNSNSSPLEYCLTMANEHGPLAAIVNVAQHRSFNLFPDESVPTLLTNVGLVTEIARWCHQRPETKYVHFSSGGIYNFKSTQAAHEDDDLSNADLGFYLSTKRMAEQVLSEFRAVSLNVSVIRPFFIYGPNMSDDRLIGRLASSIRNGLPITIAGASGPAINPCHVDDVVELVLRILNIEHPVVSNAAGSSVLTIRELAEAIAFELSATPTFIHSDLLSDDCVGSTNTMRKILNRAPIGILDSGVLSGLLQA